MASADQGFPDAIKKTLRRKDICLSSFLMQMKVPCSGKKMSQRTFFSKEEKQVPEFKAVRGQLTLMFCANAVGFTIRTALIPKLLIPEP